MKRLLTNLHLISWITDNDSAGRITDEEFLLEQCRKGNRSAQKRLFDSLAPKMSAICLRYMGNRDDSDDVLQEGFVTLFSKLDSFQGIGSFEGWARRIFVNTALMHLRKKDALKMSDGLDAAFKIGNDEHTPIENLGYKELLRMVAALPDGLRTVFNLYVIEGYSHKEIAESLGMEEATSRSKLQRARARLQEMIKKLNEHARH